MVWKKETSNGFEQRKVRPKIADLLKGTILDVGCGGEKIVPAAVGVDLFSPADILIDLSSPKPLQVFASNFFDVVFSSHCLEDMVYPEELLREMCRVLRSDGILILYLPHKDLYPNVGCEGANIRHQHDFIPLDISVMLDNIGGFVTEKIEICSDNDEYSFLYIARKSYYKAPEIITPTKKAIVCRYGAYGDAIQVTPLLTMLKQDGFSVIMNCTKQTMPIYENNPNIDDFILVDKYTIPNTHLHEYHSELRKRCDKFINLCESIERTLLIEGKDENLFNLPKWARHARCNINYTDWILALGGYNVKGMNPEIYISDYERYLLDIFRGKKKDKFLVQWALSGSSYHKVFPFADEIMLELTKETDDIEFYLCGGNEIRMLDFDNKKIHSKVGVWTIRQSIIMPSIMDLVVAPETGVINAAGAFDVPKICLLTHSSKENLTKYWINDYSLESKSECSPCHKSVYETEGCPMGGEFNLPVCISVGHSKESVKNRIMEVYGKWLTSRN